MPYSRDKNRHPRGLANIQRDSSAFIALVERENLFLSGILLGDLKQI